MHNIKARSVPTLFITRTRLSRRVPFWFPCISICVACPPAISSWPRCGPMTPEVTRHPTSKLDQNASVEAVQTKMHISPPVAHVPLASSRDNALRTIPAKKIFFRKLRWTLTKSSGKCAVGVRNCQTKRRHYWMTVSYQPVG